MKGSIKILIFILPVLLLALVLSLMGGCLPWPHTTPRSAEVQGRVLDAQTHLPIKGAKVFLVQSPHYPTHTDANGHFRLQATRQFKLAYNEGAGWPDTKGDIIEISHPDYLPYDFSPGMVGSINVGDILLKPKQ